MQVLKNLHYNEKCDVYSFAMCVYEIHALDMPWTGVNPMEVAVRVATKAERPAVPANCPPEIATLLVECWDQEPSKRRNFAEACKRLKQYADDKAINLPPRCTEQVLNEPAEREGGQEVEMVEVEFGGLGSFAEGDGEDEEEDEEEYAPRESALDVAQLALVLARRDTGGGSGAGGGGGAQHTSSWAGDDGII